MVILCGILTTCATLGLHRDGGRRRDDGWLYQPGILPSLAAPRARDTHGQLRGHAVQAFYGYFALHAALMDNFADMPIRVYNGDPHVQFR
jgi:hypothetical protein